MLLSQYFLKNAPWKRKKTLLTSLTSFQVHAEEISGNNGYVELFFCAKKLDDKVRTAHSNTQCKPTETQQCMAGLEDGTCGVLIF